MTTARRDRLRSDRTRAFSLMEVVIVIAVMTTILVIAQPRVAEALQRQRLRGAVDVLVADLKLARSEAIRMRTYTLVVFDTTKDRYAAWYIDTSADPPAWAVMQDPLMPRRRMVVELGADPDRGADILLASFEDVSAVGFDPYGSAIQGGGIVLGLGRLRVEAKMGAGTGGVNVGPMYEDTVNAAPARERSAETDGVAPADIGASGGTRTEEPTEDGKGGEIGTNETPTEPAKGETPTEDGGKTEATATEPVEPEEGLVGGLLRALLR